MKKQVFLSISIVIILLGCTPSGFDLLDQPGHTYSQIDKSNISDISEIMTFSGGRECGAITAIQLILDKNLVYGYCSKSKELIIWNILSEFEEERYVLDTYGDLGISISKDGNSILSPSQREGYYYSESNEIIKVISIWTKSDHLNPTCIHLCESDYDDEYFESIRGIAISPQGNLVLIYYPFWYELIDLENNESHNVGLSGDADYHVDIGYMTFHPNNEKLAVSYREHVISWYGDVEIFQLSGPSIFDNRRLKDNSNQDLQYVKALEFSPNGKWIANITDDGINLWKINFFKTHRLLEFNKADIIAFSGSSDLLFIGTNDELVVYDLYAKEITSIIKTPNIESISLPSGNEILAWGDSKGLIHILGLQQIDAH